MTEEKLKNYYYGDEKLAKKEETKRIVKRIVKIAIVIIIVAGVALLAM